MAIPEVIFLTVPPIGHIKPTIELAKLLLRSSSSRLSITVLTIPSSFPSWDAATAPLISSAAAANLRFESLPYVPTSPREAESPDAYFARFIHGHNPHLHAALSRRLAAKAQPIAALILDVFCWPAIDIARDLGLPAYFYVTWNAAMLSYMLHLPCSTSTHVPGMGAVPEACVPRFMMEEVEARRLFVENGRRFREARGLIVNTFEELEPAVLEAIAGGECVAEGETPPVFSVGPILAMEEAGGRGEGRECLEWLDEQPDSSVVFICLGSMGSIDAEQAKAVAAALEHSGQRFLWVLRTPIPNHPLYLPKDFTNLEEILPTGFLQRTKDKGMVWPTWLPQTKILSHKSIGGFVTHCGWNSCLESLWLGVPMLAWPLFFDQHLNAFNIVHQLQLGFELRMDRNNKNFVEASEFEKGLESLMGEEGRKLRERIEVMRSIMQKVVVDRSVMKMLANKMIEECPILK